MNLLHYPSCDHVQVSQFLYQNGINVKISKLFSPVNPGRMKEYLVVVENQDDDGEDD